MTDSECEYASVEAGLRGLRAFRAWLRRCGPRLLKSSYGDEVSGYAVAYEAIRRAHRFRASLRAMLAAQDANTLTPQEKAGGWRLLFDGKTTHGWRSARSGGFPSTGWAVRDGTLAVTETVAKRPAGREHCHDPYICELLASCGLQDVSWSELGNHVLRNERPRRHLRISYCQTFILASICCIYQGSQ